MENNEDKRMTVIAAEIEQQKGELKRHNSLLGIIDNTQLRLESAKKIVGIEHTISILQSLLEPEKEALIDFAKEYKTAAHYEAISPRTYFNETYTQQTK